MVFSDIVTFAVLRVDLGSFRKLPQIKKETGCDCRVLFILVILEIFEAFKGK